MKTLPPLGIMQGRLLPPIGERFQAFPTGKWEQEFPAAESAGMAFIEWIFDADERSENPLSTDAGIAQIKDLARIHQVAIRSVCADCFMSDLLVRGSNVEMNENRSKLRWLVERCALLGAVRLILPFVDSSRLASIEEEDALIELLAKTVEMAGPKGVELHLETDLAPIQFAKFLAKIPFSFVKVNYDSGNSASFGYNADEEFDCYGDRIGSVHIKDRILGGSTVALGKGSADLPLVIERLIEIGYRGDLVLQTARERPGDEISLARNNRHIVEKLWENSNS